MLRRFFKYIFLTLISLVFCLTVFVGGVLFHLSRGPLNLDFLQAHLTDYILSQGETLTFETLQLAWDDLEAPLRLEGLGVSYTHGPDKKREAYLEKGQLYFPLRSLLMGHVIPKKIILEGAHVTVRHFVEQKDSGRYQADLNFQKINKVLDAVLDLKTVQIHKSSLVLHTQAHPFTLTVSADISQNQGLLTGTILAERQGGRGHIQSGLSYQKGTDALHVTLDLADFDSQTLKTLVPDLFLQDLVFQDFALQGHYRYFLKTKKHKARLKSTLSNIDLHHTSYWKEPLKLPSLSFEGTLDGNTFQIKEIATSIHGMPIKAQTTGSVDEKTDHVALETRVQVRDIPFKDLEKIWPQGAAQGARSWITQNITGGTASSATLILKNHLDFSGQKAFFNLDHLSGTIEINQALLTYVQTMPAITDLRATATFDHEHFDIKIKNGKTHGLTLTSGDIFIGNFSDETSRLDLKIFLEGGLGQVLSLIDHPPLLYAQDYDLNPKTSDGQTNATLQMTFPLASPFKTQDIQTTVTAQVKKARLRKLAGLDVDLTQGDLRIDVGPQEVTVKGTALLNGAPSHLQLVKKIESQRLDLKVHTEITPLSLGKIWHDAGFFFKGTAPLFLHYHLDNAKKGLLNLTFDLKDAALNTLVMTKKKGVPGHLSVTGDYHKGRLTKIKNISFQDDAGWIIKGDGLLASPTGTLKDLMLTWHHKGKKVMAAHYLLHQHNHRLLTLTGEHIDLKNFMETDLSALSTPSHLAAYPQDKNPLKIQVKAQKITVGKDSGLLDNALTVQLENGLIRKLAYTGHTEQGDGKNQDVYAEIYQKKNGLRTLRVQTEQGGAFLKALGLFDNIRGGQFKLIAYHDPAFRKEEWVGKIRVRNFILLKAPLLTRILSLIPTGGAELTRDGGMNLSLMKMRFGLSPKAFTIHGSRAHGVSVGFNLSGEIERKQKGLLNLKGTMIPLYVLNTLISKIPLIGEVISGGKNEGLFSVSFSVTGTKDNPDITANPLSLITPGITRNIFPSAQSSLTRDDGWIDQPDKDNDIFDQEFKTQSPLSLTKKRLN